MNIDELTGRTRSHVVTVPELACTLHSQAVAPFLNLRRAARAAGIDLKPVSGFRDFDRQLSIWNAKFRGDRPLYDAAGLPLDAALLPKPARVDAILQWSALPGASRHHWGTDVDLIDARAIAADYRVQLTAREFANTGPFAPLAEWLDLHAAHFGFFRPFRGLMSGVQAEPWHYSWAPLAMGARLALRPSVLRAALLGAPLEGKEQVLERLDELHARYVSAIDWP